MGERQPDGGGIVSRDLHLVEPEPPEDVMARLRWEADRAAERARQANAARSAARAERPKRGAEHASRSAGDPLRMLAERCWPVDLLPPDDPGDIRAWCAYYDAVANRGAGAPRERD